MNQSMDPKQEQRVWSRVMSAQNGCCTQEPEVCRRLEQKDIPVFDEAAAMELYAAQLGAAAAYRCLAGMARGCARQALMHLAESRRCDGKRLSALYFVMTGLKACPDRPKLPCVSCLNEALRQAYREERCTAELYSRYAANAGEYACTLEQLGKNACKRAQELLNILQVSL